MADVIANGELLDAVEKETFIKGGDTKCVEGIKYDLRASAEVLKAEWGRPLNVSNLTSTEQRELCIQPGEMVFLLSEERLNLPKDIMVQLSPKRKLSHCGILSIGGFCVDPGYEGRLLVGLYNLSSTAFPIIPGRKLIAASFFRLKGSETGEFPDPDPGIEEFPDELIQIMGRYKPLSLQRLAEAVKTLELELSSLRSEIRSHEEWYKRFEQSLEKHDKQIGDLLSGLDKEAEARRQGQSELSTSIQAIEKNFSFIKGASWFVGVLLALVLIPIGLYFLQELLWP